MVNCNENAYIANYRKMGKPIEYKSNTNERVKISTFPPIVSHDEIGNEEGASYPINLFNKKLENFN